MSIVLLFMVLAVAVVEFLLRRKDFNRRVLETKEDKDFFFLLEVAVVVAIVEDDSASASSELLIGLVWCSLSLVWLLALPSKGSAGKGSLLLAADTAAVGRDWLGNKDRKANDALLGLAAELLLLLLLVLAASALRNGDELE